MFQYIFGYLALEYIHQTGVKNQAISYVNSIPGPKLNIGAAGAGQLSGAASLNSGKKCDICPDYLKDIEYCALGEHLPYNDREFEVVFASHVLEHVSSNKVRFALKEMARVGNKVVIVLPNPLSHGFYTGLGHQSYIYKINLPNGVKIKNTKSTYEEHIYLDPGVFKIFQ